VSIRSWLEPSIHALAKFLNLVSIRSWLEPSILALAKFLKTGIVSLVSFSPDDLAHDQYLGVSSRMLTPLRTVNSA